MEASLGANVACIELLLDRGGLVNQQDKVSVCLQLPIDFLCHNGGCSLLASLCANVVGATSTFMCMFVFA